MARALFSRLMQTLLVLAVVSIAAFWFLKLAPGDPVSLMLGAE